MHFLSATLGVSWCKPPSLHKASSLFSYKIIIQTCLVWQYITAHIPSRSYRMKMFVCAPIEKICESNFWTVRMATAPQFSDPVRKLHTTTRTATKCLLSELKGIPRTCLPTYPCWPTRGQVCGTANDKATTSSKMWHCWSGPMHFRFQIVRIV